MTPPLSHVACVDDDRDILEIVRLTLETVGEMKVSCFGDAKKALFELESLKPDVILTDSRMPGMTGQEFFRELRRKMVLRETPVIFMTARVQPEEIEEYLRLGATGVIMKPFNPMSLANEIQVFYEKTINKKRGDDNNAKRGHSSR